MFTNNIPKILSQIGPTDRVLDIGGWAQSFARADYVMDAMPYETRGWLKQPAASGAHVEKEHFSAATWIQRDMCDRTPWPFEDKFFDYVVCSHTLEDIRDPLWSCSEILRVGKRGYIEVPSKLYEFTFDPAMGMVGQPHHRWLVTIEGTRLTFEMKYHSIHKPGFHLPAYARVGRPPEDEVQWLFWNDHFDYQEASVPHGLEDIENRLRSFVVAHPPRTSVAGRCRFALSQGTQAIKKKLPKPLKRVLKKILPL